MKEHEHPTPAEKAFGAHARSQRDQATEHDHGKADSTPGEPHPTPEETTAKPDR